MIKAFEKFPSIAPKTITQTIIRQPEYRYLITLKETPTNDIGLASTEYFIRNQIIEKIKCDKVIFEKNTIEIWSEKELDLATLTKDKMVTLTYSNNETKAFGSGIKSVTKIKD